MDNLKVGDIITFQGIQKAEVRDVLQNIIFTRIINNDGSVSPTDFGELEDLITYGWTKIEK